MKQKLSPCNITYKTKLLLITLFIGALFSNLLLSCKETKEENFNVFTANWEHIEERARGQKVIFNGWGGSIKFNEYIQWVAERLLEEYDITLVHVLTKNGLEGVHKVQQEKAAGIKKGSVDLLWVNGTAFHSLNDNNLMLGNILDIIPNKKYIDSNNPVLSEDFTVPTNGKEVPWGTAQLTFFRRGRVENFDSYDQLLDIVKKYPNKFTYASPNLNFVGLTFIKGLIYAYTDDTTPLYQSYKNADKEKINSLRSFLEANKTWTILDEIRPYLWRQGKVYPQNQSKLEELFKSGEIDYSMTFNPFYALNKVITKDFPEDVEVFQPQEGTISNAHFLTIPYNASSKEAALVTINFLLSSAAQARKANPDILGDPTVYDTHAIQNNNNSTSKYLDYPSYPSPNKVGKNPIREFDSTVEQEIKSIWMKRTIK